MADLIQIRRDTEANWQLINPILADGERALSKDLVPKKIKTGDGVHNWVDIEYDSGLKGDKGNKGDTGPAGVKGDKGDTGDAGSTGPAGNGDMSTSVFATGNTANTHTVDHALTADTIAAGSATDTAIGDRTADPVTATTYSLTGSITQWLSWILKRIAEIAGVAWGTACPASLLSLFNQKWTDVRVTLYNPAAGYVSPLYILLRNCTGYNIYFHPQGPSVSAATTINIFQGSGTLTLAAAITSTTATTMTTNISFVFTGSPLALIDANGVPEVVQMTAGSGTTTITIVRGQGGTTASTHLTGGLVLRTLAATTSISALSPTTLSASGITGTANDIFAYNVVGAGLSSCNLVITPEWVNR